MDNSNPIAEEKVGLLSNPPQPTQMNQQPQPQTFQQVLPPTYAQDQQNYAPNQQVFQQQQQQQPQQPEFYQPGMNPYQQPVGYQNVSYQQPPIIVSSHIVFGEAPTRIYCATCRREVVTEIIYEAGTLTWVAAGGLALLGCIFGCCLIPFCIDGCKDVVHVCPQCHSLLGKKTRI